jgi:hypothetical protein
MARINKVIKGLKLVTDTLPFEKKLEQISQNGYLVQYLMMCSIFAHSSINMVLSSILNKFCEDDDFLESVWDAIAYCAKL